MLGMVCVTECGVNGGLVVSDYYAGTRGNDEALQPLGGETLYVAIFYV